MSNEWKPTKLTIDCSAVPEGSIAMSYDVKILFDDEPFTRMVRALQIVVEPGEPVVARMDIVLSELEVKNLPAVLQAQFEEQKAMTIKEAKKGIFDYINEP